MALGREPAATQKVRLRAAYERRPSTQSRHESRVLKRRLDVDRADGSGELGWGLALFGFSAEARIVRNEIQGPKARDIRADAMR